MPRNEAHPLSQAAAMRAYTLRAALQGAQSNGQEVSMRYVKRDGTESASTGAIVGFPGRDGMDTMSVDIVDRVKGIRTINLNRVIKAWPVQDEAPIADQTDPEDN